MSVSHDYQHSLPDAAFKKAIDKLKNVTHEANGYYKRLFNVPMEQLIEYYDTSKSIALSIQGLEAISEAARNKSTSGSETLGNMISEQVKQLIPSICEDLLDLLEALIKINPLQDCDPCANDWYYQLHEETRQVLLEFDPTNTRVDLEQ